MGLSKRLISEKTIKETFKEQKSLSKLFKADAFIFMDEVSSKVYSLFVKGYNDEEIEKLFNLGKL